MPKEGVVSGEREGEEEGRTMIALLIAHFLLTIPP